MAMFAIAVLQISSPFILVGLLLYWIYQISKRANAVERRTRGIDEQIELLHCRISDTDKGLYKKICSVEEAVEELDDVVMSILEREEEKNARKAPSKTK